MKAAGSNKSPSPRSARGTSYTLRVFGALGACAALAVVGVAGHSAVAADPSDLMPDLAQESPRDIVISEGTKTVRVNGRRVKRRVVRLAFTSQVDNIGSGPFIVYGKRSSRRQSTLKAYQTIKNVNGTQRTVTGVGKWYYERNRDHEHWHYKAFDVFKLRDRIGTQVAKSSKQGFCLGDRGKGITTLPNAVPQPVYVGHCGLKKPKALRINGGISVGWGDDYQAYLEGQSIDVTKLHAGIYCLDHRATSAFEEVDYQNNTAVALVRIDPAASPPTVETVGTLSIADGVAAPTCASAYSLAGLAL